jgi:cytochrome c oxidase subunit 1/cytochrome c oxidase subunit I+III
MNERLGKISFFTQFIGFNLVFFPMHLLGILGMPRRIYTYPGNLGWDGMNLLETVGAFVLALGVLISVWNFFVSLRHGEVAGDNPWNADSLEWDVSSPPPVYGTERIPTVATRHPLWDDVDEHDDPFDERILDHRRVTLVTSALDAEPTGVAKMPEETVTPLLMALTLTAFFGAMVVKALWIALAAVVVALVVMAVWLWPEPERVIA